jgi:hypothetical protein
MTARLHQHGAREPEALVQRGKLLVARIRRCVRAIVGEGEPIDGTEHVAVGVTRSGRWREGGRWVRVGVRGRDRAFHVSI